MTAQAPRKYPRTARFLGAAAALFAVLGFAAPGLFFFAFMSAFTAWICILGVRPGQVRFESDQYGSTRRIHDDMFDLANPMSYYRRPFDSIHSPDR